MFINEARLNVEKDGKVTELKRDNIDRLASICKLHGPHAQVGVNVGTTIGYGEMKIDVSVTLTCDQTEVAMDEAARIALDVGHDFMNQGLIHHGLAPVKFNAASLWDKALWDKAPAKESPPDRVALLCSGRGALAHVGVNVGTTIGYGEVKLKSNVRLACDQNEARLSEAAGLAIEKSNEYTRWGLAGYDR